MYKMRILVAALAVTLAAPVAQAIEAQFWFNINAGGVQATIGTQPVVVVRQPVYLPEPVFTQQPVVIQGIGTAYYFNGRYYVQPVHYTGSQTVTFRTKFQGPPGAFVPPGLAKKGVTKHPGRGHGKGKNK